MYFSYVLMSHFNKNKLNEASVRKDFFFTLQTLLNHFVKVQGLNISQVYFIIVFSNFVMCYENFLIITYTGWSKKHDRK